MKNRRGFIRLKFFTRTNFKEISAGKENFGGFTIIELMIATVIFSVILLIMTSALILLGRIYFKGLVSVRTQEVARQIADDISQNIQFGGGTISSNPAPSGGIAGICIGSRQYSYILKQELTDTSGHKFVARTVSSSCPSSPLTSMDSLTNGQQELLGTNMRLTKLDVSSVGSNLWSIDVGVAYGADGVFDTNWHCLGTAGSQFCATAEISTTVEKRI